MDVDIVSIETLETELRSIIQFEGTEKSIFTAQDSMDNMEPLENEVLTIQIPSIDDTPDLLYSEDIYKSVVNLGIEMPVDNLVKIKNKTVVLIGVSGCGKTRSCFDLCRIEWCLYFDCSEDNDFLFMLEQLKGIRPKEKSEQSQHDFQNHSEYLIQCLISARLFVLNTLRQNPNFKSFDWLCTQRSRRTQLLFGKILLMLSKNSVSVSSALYLNLRREFQNEGRIIFDESQTLLERLKLDYRSSKDFQHGITSGVFDHPRSFFSFLTGTIIDSGLRSIWCGTHMKIRNMELIQSSAGEKPRVISLFTKFTYLTATNVAQLLSKWLKLDTYLDAFFIQQASHWLQGRPRFMISFLHRLRGISDRSLLLPVLNDYCSVMATKQGKENTNSSLYSFWSQRITFDIVPFGSVGDPTFEKRLIPDLLIKLCISHLFGNGERINYSPDLDMVSTGLVMVKKEGDTWSAIMAEPLSLTAGLNFLADQNFDALMDYFANQLFVPLVSPNLTAQERGNMMELVITLRFLQGWWTEPAFEQFLPQWIRNRRIERPRGVLDGRNGTGADVLFIQQLRNSEFPWVVLPATKAGPDIRYSFFSCYVKTSWTKNSATTMFVSPEECYKNIQSMNPSGWYSSEQLINSEVKESLPDRLFHMRFELPYTAPSLRKNGFNSSLEGNFPILCVDLNSELCEPFFGKRFVQKYLDFFRQSL